uniref:RAD51 interacting motif domain-containing protein n=1 Tax=Leptobrachium leishanense TaxID=445787 RepID=A0A8C5M876_9ANUR
MDRPVRAKKAVDYSQFGDPDNDDEDFACSSAPPSKRSRVESREKKEKSVKKTRKEDSISRPSSQGNSSNLPTGPPPPPCVARLAGSGTRKQVAGCRDHSEGSAGFVEIPLDDKLYQRDLEAALVLSTLDKLDKKNTLECFEDQFIKVSPTLSDDSTTHEDVPFSNCTVDGSTLGLEEITNFKEEPADGRSRRQAASKAIIEQRKLLAEDSDNEDAEDEFKPDVASYGSSESDSNLSEEDEEFEFQKSSKLKAAKGTKQKSVKKNSKENNAVPKAKTTASSFSAPASFKIKSLPSQKSLVSSPALVKPNVCHSSPSVGVGKPKWTPPAPANTSRDSPGGASVRSPNQGLRLGLSRFARVRPLHPAIVNH